MNLSRRFSDQKNYGYPFYLISVMTVLIAILLINGYFEIQRTRDHLFNLLENEALVVITGVEKNSGNLMTALTREPASLPGPGAIEGSEEKLGIEDLLIERLINLAWQLDRGSARSQTPSNSADNQKTPSGLSRIFFLPAPLSPEIREKFPGPLKTGKPFFQEVLSGKSRLAVYRGEGGLRQILPLAIAVARPSGQGIILILLTFDEYVFMSQQIIIQGFMADFAGMGNVAYMRLEDPAGKVIAQTGERTGAIPFPPSERIEIRNSRLFWINEKGGDFLEVVRPFRPAGKEIGVIRLGLSLKEVNPILNQSRRNIILMGLVLFGLGLIGLYFVFRLQGRHLQKLKEMENEIRLKEELSAMGQLAAGVAHEIKNPLNAISLVVQRLEKEFIPDSPEEQKEYERFTGIVRKEIMRVNRIIADFLLMARPLESKLEERSILDILEYVLEVLGVEFEQKHIRVTKQWDEKIPLISGDRFQLTQAFINVLNNALEAMPGGGEIRISVRPIRISDFGFRISEYDEKDSAIRNPPSAIEIKVADTGKGIPPDGLPKIFAPYYTTKEKGVGLGLAITQKIILAHGGTFEVESLENKGTTVIIRLPVSPRQ
jgi:signal transduction histidine kinase